MATATEAPEEHKISIRMAVQIAVDAFVAFFPSFASNNLLLEEVEESEDGRFWTITLGYDDKRTLSVHDKMFKPESYRAYKTFKIDTSTGKVMSMKIRTLD
jgi:hypothetical protein